MIFSTPEFPPLTLPHPPPLGPVHTLIRLATAAPRPLHLTSRPPVRAGLFEYHTFHEDAMTLVKLLSEQYLCKYMAAGNIRGK